MRTTNETLKTAQAASFLSRGRFRQVGPPARFEEDLLPGTGVLFKVGRCTSP